MSRSWHTTAALLQAGSPAPSQSQDHSEREPERKPLLPKKERNNNDVGHNDMLKDVETGACMDDGQSPRCCWCLQSMAMAYHGWLERHPLLVKCVTAMILLGLANFVEQSLSQYNKLDWVRVLHFAVYGLVLQAPFSHYYYYWLDTTFPPTEYPWTRRTFLKVVIDQSLQAPLFTLMTFFFLDYVERGLSWHDFVLQVQQRYGPTLIANWQLWIPATIINLGLVPPIYRVLYLNVVFFIWCIILSIVLVG